MNQNNNIFALESEIFLAKIEKQNEYRYQQLYF